MIKGVLFDMDGVLIDSERLGERILAEFCESRGYAPPEGLFKSILGITNQGSYVKLREIMGADFPAEESMDDIERRLEQMSRERAVPPKPGLHTCLRELRAMGLKMAIATSTGRALAMCHLTALGVDGYFDALVCGGECPRGKPAPDIYLKAASAVNIKPEFLVGVEDSRNGLKALSASGVISVMIPDLLPYDESFADTAQYVLGSLDELPGLIRRLNAKEARQ